MIELFKIFEDFDDVKPTDFFTMSSTRLRGHVMNLVYRPTKPLAYMFKVHLDIRISLQSIDEWNRLPETVLHCNTLPTFKSDLNVF